MYPLINDSTEAQLPLPLSNPCSMAGSYGQTNPLTKDIYPLLNAVKLFQESYIPAVADYTGAPGMKGLSRVLEYDRSELSDRIYHELEIGLPASHGHPVAHYAPCLEDYLKTFGTPLIDSAAFRVFAEAVETNDYDLKKQTNRFKELYVTAVVREHAGEAMQKAAAQRLGVSPKTIANWLRRYYCNPNNSLAIREDSSASYDIPAPEKHDALPPDALAMQQELKKIA